MKRWFLPALILLFATPCCPKAFAQSPMPEIKPGKNSVAIRGRRQKLYFYPGAGASPHQLRKQLRWILRRLGTGNAMDQTTRGASHGTNSPSPRVRATTVAFLSSFPQPTSAPRKAVITDLTIT